MLYFCRCSVLIWIVKLSARKNRLNSIILNTAHLFCYEFLFCFSFFYSFCFFFLPNYKFSIKRGFTIIFLLLEDGIQRGRWMKRSEKRKKKALICRGRMDTLFCFFQCLMLITYQNILISQKILTNISLRVIMVLVRRYIG